MAFINIRIRNKLVQAKHENFAFILGAIKTLNGRKWVPENKWWEVEDREENLEKLKEFFSPAVYDSIVQERQTRIETLSDKVKKDFPFLYEFQTQGVLDLLNGKTLLADHVGLGKTIQAIAFAELIEAKRILIVCPSPLKRQWAKELDVQFGRDATIVEGNSTQRKNIITGYQTGYMIVNYELLIRDFVAGSFDLVIFDEVHRIKNGKSQTHKAARTIVAAKKIGLSATPFVNNPAELYTICKFLNPGFIAWENFLVQHCLVEFNRFAGKHTIVGYNNLPALHEKLKKMMIRREKKDVLLQLPDRTYKTYSIDLPRSQQVVVDHYTRNAEMAFDKEDKDNILANITLARMACDSNELVALSNSPLAVRPKELASEKLKVLLEILSDWGFR